MINPFTYLKIIEEMIKKNFKVLIRSKSSALVILLGPFLIIFLIGAAFNTTSLHGIRVAIYAEDPSNSVLDQIKTSLKDNDFAITETASEDQCITMVKSGGAHICISFPGSLTKDSFSRQIIFHVDYSKVNLVFTILNVITNQVKDISTDLSVEYTRLLIEQMNKTGAEIEQKSSLVGSLSDNAKQMKENLQTLSLELNGINVSTQEFGLSDTAFYISQSQSQIDQFSTITEETTTNGLDLLDSLSTYITSFKSDLETQITTVEGFQSTVDTYETLACAFDFSQVSGLTFDPCSDLESVASSLNDTVVQAQSLGSQFDDIQSQLDSVKSQLESAQQEQSTILSTAQTNLQSLQTQLNSSSTKISEMSDKKDAIASDIDSLVSMLDENIATIADVQSSIGNISSQLKNGDLEDPEHIVNPILTQIKPILEKKSYLDYTMPALVVLIIMFMSILLSSTIVMTEKGSRAYFRNYITPIPDLLFLMSIYITNLIIVSIQASILLVIAQVAFGVSIFSNIIPIAIAVLIISSIFILLGMCIGYLFVSEETATLASISASSIFLLFSSFLIPIESLSETIAAVAVYNPFVLAEGVLRQLIIFGNGLASAGNDLFVLILYVFILAATLYVCEAIDKRRFH